MLGERGFKGAAGALLIAAALLFAPPALAGSRTPAPSAGDDSGHRSQFAMAAINRGLTPGETLWHVRAALNVASLSCTGPERSAIIANYNYALKRHRDVLARAYASEQHVFRTRFGRDWQRHNDTHLTRLYDFFSKPMAQVRFCAVALEVSDQVRALGSEQLEAYAPDALARLERPFISTESASR